MELVYAWLTTVVAAIGLDIANELKLFKLLADEGYKVNFASVKEFNKNNDISSSNYKRLTLVPIYNVASAMKRVMDFNNNIGMVLDQFKVLGSLEEMTDEELAKYKKILPV